MFSLYSKNVSLSAIYKLILILLIVSFPAGAYLFKIDVGFAHLFLYRLTLLIALGLLILKKNVVFFTGKFTKSAFFILLGWILYAAISIFWALNKTAAVKEVFAIGIALVLFIVLVSLSKIIKNSTALIREGWLAGFVIYSILAIYEIVTKQHIQGNFTDFIEGRPPGHPIYDAVISSVGGPNEFSSYLSFSLPFIGFLVISKKSPWGYLTIGFILYVIYVNDAKLAMISFSAQLIASVFLYFKELKNYLISKLNKKHLTFYVLICSLSFGVITFNNYIPNPKRPDNIDYSLMESIMVNMNGLKTDPIAGEVIGDDDRQSSFYIRKVLFLNGLGYFIKSNFFGIGAGNYSYYTKMNYGNYSASGVIDPHSWAIEILSQYGLPVFLPYFGWFFFVFHFFWKNHGLINKTNVEMKFLVTAGILLIVCFAICSNSSSSFMMHPLNWFTFSFISIFADKLHYSIKHVREVEISPVSF